MMQKDTSVPGGTIETFGFWSRTPLSDCPAWVDRPVPPSSRRQLQETGLLSLSPFLLRPPGYGGQAGTRPQRILRGPQVDAQGQSLDRNSGYLSVAEQGFFGIAGSAGVAINSTGTRSIHLFSQKTNQPNQPNEAAVDKI